MDTANANPAWWQVLPVAVEAKDTDLCGKCGRVRDIHTSEGTVRRTGEKCVGEDFRVAGYVGAYDRIPDGGDWAASHGKTKDCRDIEGVTPFTIPKGYKVA